MKSDSKESARVKSRPCKYPDCETLVYGKHRYCKPHKRVMTVKNSASYYRRNKTKILKTREKSPGAKWEKCKCPKCKHPHKQEIYYTGARFYNPDGSQKPLPYFCETCVRDGRTNVEEPTAAYVDVRFAYAKWSV